MTKNLDLDAARAERAARGEAAPSVTVDGKTYELPREMPWAVVEAVAAGDAEGVANAVRLLLGEQWEDFKAHNISAADMVALITHVGESYGETLGKA